MTVGAATQPSTRARGFAGWGLSIVADLGGITILLAKGLAAMVRPRRDAPPLLRATTHHAGWIIALGLPLVGLVHVSLGSFLAMQAYFGATFTEGTGIVVGLGLIRNISPLMTGFVLAGLCGVRMTGELRGGGRPGLDDPRSLPDRDVARGDRVDARPIPASGRIAFARVLGAAIAGPCLSLAGVVVGTLLGLAVARSMLGQSPAIFLIKIAEMLQPVDVAGLLIKGMAFAGSAALIATYEGLRPESQGGPNAYRAVLRSVLAVLILNFTWFNLVYLTGDPFGPNVAASAG